MSRQTAKQMRNWIPVTAGLLLWGGLMFSTGPSPLAAADQPAAAQTQAENSPSASADKATAPRKKIVNRLPNNFGKLGLTESQRQKIYALQSQYRAQLEALTAQLEALREEQNEEIESVLTPAQKAELHKLQRATQNKRTTPPATTKAAPDTESDADTDS